MMKDKQRTKCEGRSVARIRRSGSGKRAGERESGRGGGAVAVGRSADVKATCVWREQIFAHSLTRSSSAGGSGRGRTDADGGEGEGRRESERASERSVSERGGGGAERVERNQILFGRRKEIVSALYHYLCVENSRGNLTLSRPKSAGVLHLLLTPDLKDSKLMFPYKCDICWLDSTQKE